MVDIVTIDYHIFRLHKIWPFVEIILTFVNKQ